MIRGSTSGCGEIRLRRRRSETYQRTGCWPTRCHDRRRPIHWASNSGWGDTSPAWTAARAASWTESKVRAELGGDVVGVDEPGLDQDLLGVVEPHLLAGDAHRASEYLTRGNRGSSASGVGSSRSVSRSG